MPISHTIPGKPYRDPQPVAVPYLTDAEIQALSYAYFDKQFDVRVYEDMAGKGGIISGWNDVTPAHEAARIARLREAMISLDRLGLVEGYYEHAGPSSERVLTIDSKGLMRIEQSGWRYKLNDQGALVQASHRATIHKCCDGCVRLHCVCREKTSCAEHGGGCHGTHD